MGDEVVVNQPLADGPSTDHGELALGQNLTVAYMSWEGYNYEDAIVVSERVVAEDLLTTINISRHEIDARDTKLGPEEITREIPNLSEDMLANLDEDGIIRIGAEVGPGDILVGKVTPKGESALTAEERLLRAIFGAKAHDVRDTSLKMPHGSYGRVIDVVRFSRENGDDLAPGVNEMVRVYVAQRRKIQEGDKIAGRHGNKGVISKILPIEDMPYMADGTPVDVILNPLGVPSRMNVGQLLECHLGWAAACGWDEDAIVVSERVVAEDLLTTINISRHEIDARDTKLGPEEITREIPNLSEDMLANLDEDGIIRIGAEVGPGDILVGKVTPKGESALTAEERLLRAIFGAKAHDVRDTSLKMPHGSYGRVIDVVRFSRENGDDLAPGVNEMVRVYVAQRRKIQEGDKIAGRHGNKGVISKILPIEDMPYMADGTPVDVILNPLGVPSRMNVGQLLECHLGWAAACGWDPDNADSDKYVPGPFFTATPVFDGAHEDEIAEVIRRANKNMVNLASERFGDHMRTEFVTQLDERGKTRLFDGRSGEEFREPITVGTSYILKLGHMVDDKIHARSTGPYSLVTQQPLGGKAQFGGQRFGEMEVWALYAYGASNVLQEILTVKSDDTVGRVKTYEAIVKGDNVPTAGIPESFKVLVKEIRSLALDIEPIRDAEPETAAEQDMAVESMLDADSLPAIDEADTSADAAEALIGELAASTTDKE